jgi:hypothetical protein
MKSPVLANSDNSLIFLELKIIAVSIAFRSASEANIDVGFNIGGTFKFSFFTI